MLKKSLSLMLVCLFVHNKAIVINNRTKKIVLTFYQYHKNIRKSIHAVDFSTKISNVEPNSNRALAFNNNLRAAIFNGRMSDLKRLIIYLDYNGMQQAKRYAIASNGRSLEVYDVLRRYENQLKK